MFVRWAIGLVIGTGLVWASSPCFVRSYLPRQRNRSVQEGQGVATLPVGATYRWRSEGYARSHIGPHGMVGAVAQLTTAQPSPWKVALWGDSQAEGVCVRDADKIAARLCDRLGGTVFPMAASGDDASDWLPQLPFAETHLGANTHVFLIAQWSDLAAAVLPRAPGHDVHSLTNQVVGWIPDFCVHAARNVLLDKDQTTLRRLRFRPGPVSPTENPRTSLPPQHSDVDWHQILASLTKQAQQPVYLVYAPQLPTIAGGEIVTSDADDDIFRLLLTLAPEYQVQWIDMRVTFRASANRGAWPHGFQNGRVGSGHLNRIGNDLIAKAITERLTGASNQRAGASNQPATEPPPVHPVVPGTPR